MKICLQNNRSRLHLFLLWNVIQSYLTLSGMKQWKGPVNITLATEGTKQWKGPVNITLAIAGTKQWRLRSVDFDFWNNLYFAIMNVKLQKKASLETNFSTWLRCVSSTCFRGVSSERSWFEMLLVPHKNTEAKERKLLWRVYGTALHMFCDRYEHVTMHRIRVKILEVIFSLFLVTCKILKITGRLV
jgi:hypothetical protein